ncbi:hypothetical protein Kpol_2001p29 [Vanderwaltozyma polyspora DSM 70294]|uniref:Major facilitator superfamily (MFS) profile domain-containing protein n=1 Tax=Vanderwaltozyma polyspora (strain ATCC 22028 / DSM 70294 / BCRC 21397 / CBS 2163 / NBRC 10782 / NRRL Y-8283 / UCD 57-17) TaxID=436907 RepID=A7TGR1_VANPO|nr:uncharacterized protein Kpol_2001p29 [Vanderwaltozyma polyspora DSM 70294]EDO18524.1 hypothetical protein Kpol_2001p29 [Vanderwaltozyma polyspora DSM 70294]
MSSEPLLSNGDNHYGGTLTTISSTGYRAMSEEETDLIIEETGINVLDSLLEPQEGESDEVRWLREVRLKHIDLSWYQKPSILLICAMLSLICISDMMIRTPMISLTISKVCEGINYGDEDISREAKIANCDKQEVQRITSEITSLTIIISGILNTLLSGKWGALSDRIGRVRVFAFVGIIKLIGTIIQIYTVLPSTPYSKTLLIAPEVVQSLGGGIFAIVSNSNSYITDVAEPEYRTMSISLMMSTLYGSMGLGPILSSIIVKFSGGNYYLPVYMSLCLLVLFIVLSCTVMAEPRHSEAMEKAKVAYEEKNKKIEEKLDSIIGETKGLAKRIMKYVLLTSFYIVDIFTPLKSLWIKPREHDNSLKPRYTVILLIAIDILFVCSTVAIMPSVVLYATFKFEWTAVELGYFISISGIGRAIILLALAPLAIHLLKKRYKTSTSSIDQIDIINIRTSLITVTLSIFFLLWLKDYYISMVLFAICQALSAVSSPTLVGTIIKYCPKANVGECFGGMALISSFIMLSVSPLLLQIYGYTVSTKPELFMYIPLMCGCLSVILTFALTPTEDIQD